MRRNDMENEFDLIPKMRTRLFDMQDAVLAIRLPENMKDMTSEEEIPVKVIPGTGLLFQNHLHDERNGVDFASLYTSTRASCETEEAILALHLFAKNTIDDYHCEGIFRIKGKERYYLKFEMGKDKERIYNMILIDEKNAYRFMGVLSCKKEVRDQWESVFQRSFDTMQIIECGRR